MTLSGIFVYPIKSMAGIALQSSQPEERGLPFDRRWTLVDKDFRFLSQRAFPTLALFQPKLEKDHLLIRYKNAEIAIPYDESSYIKTARITVWEDTIHSLVAPPLINDWFSEQLGTECQLAYQGKESIRLTSSKYAPPQEVSYADGYPYLLLSEASLDRLNEKLPAEVPMNRFRPNLVISGTTAHQEDHFEDIRIGEVHFKAVKPCARCQIITIDQSNPSIGKEPLKTLSGYRRDGNKVLFGQNLLLHKNEGRSIHLGDKVEAWNVKSGVEIRE